jgi:hypothetical protein
MTAAPRDGVSQSAKSACDSATVRSGDALVFLAGQHCHPRPGHPKSFRLSLHVRHASNAGTAAPCPAIPLAALLAECWPSQATTWFYSIAV